MHPEAFQVGGLTVYWYGVLVAAGFLAGLWTASRRAPRSGISGNQILDLGPWLIVGAVVGGRLLFVVSYWREDFAGHPWWEVFMIRRGGLVFYGGFAGAALAHVLYCRIKRLPFWKLADILAPSIALGYFFGRLGCLMTGCCYGAVCELPWAIQFPIGHASHPHPVHPTQLYEAAAGLIMYAGLAWLYRRKHFEGQIFALYLMANGGLRFGIEFFRGDYPVRYLGGWATPAHGIALGLLAAGAILFVVMRRRATTRPGRK
jgi:phosphatidylglycerol---prolipoprotein diacylglyceryl transferase